MYKAHHGNVLFSQWVTKPTLDHLLATCEKQMLLSGLDRKKVEKPDIKISADKTEPSSKEE